MIRLGYVRAACGGTGVLEGVGDWGARGVTVLYVYVHDSGHVAIAALDTIHVHRQHPHTKRTCEACARTITVGWLVSPKYRP